MEQAVSLVLHLSMVMVQTLMVSQVLDLELHWQRHNQDNVIYYTDNILGIGSTMVVTVPTGSDVAYTQYAEVSLDENVDLIVAEGDDFVTDILVYQPGISTAQGIGGRIRAGTFTNKAGTGAPQLTFGAEIPVGYGLTGAGGIKSYHRW